MNLKNLRDYYNNKPVEFVLREKYELVEDNEFIPRFSLKNVKDIQNIPINEPIKFSIDILQKCISYGMVMMINYKGEKDSLFSGHERVIYPMVIGRSSKGKILIRGWHLNGWSVSNSRHIKKIWRMFRGDRVLSMSFTGSFYRLPPAGYKMNDKGMRGGIVKSADFQEIRRNQQKLIDQQTIVNKEEVSLGNEQNKFISIKVTTTNSEVDLMKAFDNAYISQSKDINTIRISFLKSVVGNKFIAVLGALGQPGNTVKVLDEKNKNLGVFKVLDSVNGSVLKNIKNVKGNTKYDLYLFDKKI